MAITVAFTDRPETVLGVAGGFLASRPVVHNLVLSLLQARAAHAEPGRYWVVAGDGDPLGVVFHSPSHFPATVTPMPADAVDAAVSAIVATGVRLPGVNGEAATAARFAGAWTERVKSGAEPLGGQRIYELSRLRPPADVPGRARQATAADRALVLRWMHDFDGETLRQGVREAEMDRRLDAGRVALWENGEAVSMAVHTSAVEGVARVNAVYTPPAQRRRGYAAACVSAVSARLVDAGLRCILYTDLANPVSNSVYRRIGYLAAAECLMYRFT